MRSSTRLRKRKNKILLVYAFRAICTNHCALGGGRVVAADNHDTAGGGQARETLPEQKKEEEAHTPVAAVPIVGSGGVGEDGGAGAGPMLVALACRSNAPGNEIYACHSCGKSDVAAVM